MQRFFAFTGVAILLGGLGSLSPDALAQGAAPKTITVKRGDTLEGIAKSNGVSAADIKRINGLKDADLLQVGQILRLPTPARKGLVVVKSGDTLESIAKANSTTVVALQKANPGVQPSKLKVGSTLRLPSAPAPTAAPAAAPAPATAAATAPVPAPAKPAGVPPIAQPPPSLPQEGPAAPPTSDRSISAEQGGSAPRSRWRYYGDTVVDWGGWKRLPDGVRYTLVQPAARDVGEARAQATAIAVDCASLRHNWRVKEAWEAWSLPAPRSVGQQIVLDLCGNAMGDERRPVPAPPTPKP